MSLWLNSSRRSLDATTGALVDEKGNVVGIVSAKLNAPMALAASGALPENVNYAIKSWQGGRCRAALIWADRQVSPTISGIGAGRGSQAEKVECG